MDQKWENNYHKLPKNGPNDPKFGPGECFKGFIDLKFFLKMDQNWAKSCP